MPDIAALRQGDPEVVAGYRLAGRIGEGGQGAVFLGHGRAGEQVAVKILHARMAGNTTARARFAREVDAMRRVAPFCTARVLAADVTGNVPYLVSEFVDGPALQQVVRRNGPLRGAELERLAIGTLTALTAVHRAGIVHRDFKPGNVLLSAQGPRVVDFGIARALDATSTLTSQAIGTPAYMAPEQLDGRSVGPAVDMFAWACTMVYAATGTPPFGNDSVPAVIGRILDDEPDLDGVPGPLREMVARCLGKDQATRPSAEQLLVQLLRRRPDQPDQVGAAGAAGAADATLEATLVEGARAAGMSTAVDPYPITRVLPRPGRRRGVVAAGTAVVAVLVVAGAVAWLLPRAADGPASARGSTARASASGASSPPPAPPPTSLIPAKVSGWNTTIDKSDDIAYDAPPSWNAGSDNRFALGVPGTSNSVELIAWGDYGQDPCTTGSSDVQRALVGFSAYKEVGLAAVAKDAVTNWALARYSREGKRKATLDSTSRRVESIKVGGMTAVHASAMVTVPAPDNCRYPPHAVIHAVAMRSPKRAHTVTAFVVVADRDVGQAVPDQTLQQIIGSLRSAAR